MNRREFLLKVTNRVLQINHDRANYLSEQEFRKAVRDNNQSIGEVFKTAGWIMTQPWRWDAMLEAMDAAVDGRFKYDSQYNSIEYTVGQDLPSEYAAALALLLKRYGVIMRQRNIDERERKLNGYQRSDQNSLPEV